MFLLKNVSLKCKSLINSPIRVMMKTMSTEIESVPNKSNEDIFLSFGFSEKMLSDKVRKHINRKKPADLKSILKFLLDAGFEHTEIVSSAQVLHLTVWSLDHRLKCMEEGGFARKKISLSLTSRLPNIYQRSVAKFKEDGLINKGINVSWNILSYTDLPKELYPPEPDDSMSFCDSQALAMESFLKWKLDISDEEYKTKFSIYKEMRMSSVRLVMKCYEVLKNEMKFSDKTLLTNIYVLFHYPSQFYEVLQNLPKMRNNESSLEIIEKHPRLLIRPVDGMLKILEICKEFGVDPEKHNFNPEIFHLSSKTVRKRLQYLSNDPFFKPFFVMDTFPLFILRYNEAKLRSVFLRETQKDFHSRQYLIQCNSKFERNLKSGTGPYCGNELISCLGKYFEMNTNKVRDELKNSPFYHSIPLLTAWITLDYLKTQGFSNEQLKSALTIVLYPKKSVEEELQMLESREEVSICRDPSTGKIKPELKLQLLLYFLEKPFHFSGQGIWAHEKPPHDIFTLNERYLNLKRKNKLSS